MFLSRGFIAKRVTRECGLFVKLILVHMPRTVELSDPLSKFFSLCDKIILTGCDVFHSKLREKSEKKKNLLITVFLNC